MEPKVFSAILILCRSFILVCCGACCLFLGSRVSGLSQGQVRDTNTNVSYCFITYKDRIYRFIQISCRLHSVILVVESGLFGLFVTAIMCDQLQAIFGDETAVEQAKQQGPYRYLYDKFHYFKFV